MKTGSLENSVFAGMFSAGWHCCGISFPGCANEFGVYFGCKAFENHLKLHAVHVPGKCIAWSYMEPCVIETEYACIYDALTYSELDDIGYHVVCNADPQVTEEALVSEIPSFAVTPTLVVKDLATDVFGSNDVRRAVETRLGVVHKPKRHDAFQEGLPKRLGFLPSSISRTSSSTLVARDNNEHSVLLVAPNSDELVDERLCVVKREHLSRTKPKTVHVGPVALDLVNYGSRESNLCQAGVFYDARHANTENAILGAYVSRVNNEEQSLLFFPGSVLPLNPHINKVLKVRFGISNLDMEGTYQMFQSTAIVQTWANVQGHQPTLLTRKGEDDERLVAQRFKNNHCQVISTFENRYKALDTTIELPRSMSLRQTEVGGFKVVSAPRKSILIRGQGSTSSNFDNDHPNFANADGVDVAFPEHLIDTNNDSNNLLHADSFTLENSTGNGKQVYLIDLATLIASGNGKARDRLATCVSTNCCIRVEIEGGQAPLVGAGMCGAYAEGTITWKTGYSQVFNCDHFVMNPFVEEKKVYVFRPVAHSDFWNPLQICDIPASFAVFFLGPYTNPPKTTVTVGIRFYLQKCEFKPKIPIEDLSSIGVVGGYHLSQIEIPQGKINVVKRMPFFPGNPIMLKGKRAYCQAGSILSQYAAVAGKATFGIFVYSSSFIKGFVNVSLVPNTSIGSISITQLLDMPYVSRVLQHGENEVVFDVGAESGLMPTVSSDVQWSENMQASVTLVIWTRGGVSAQIDGSWWAHVYLKRFEITDRQGHGLVHKQTVVANNGPWIVPDWWHNVFFWDFKTPLTTSLSHDIDLNSLVMSTFSVMGKGNVLLRSCPSVLGILSTSSFASARISVKIVWWKLASVKFSDCTHVICASTFPHGVDAMAQDHFVSSEPSGMYEFSYVLTGPFDGLRFIANDWSIAGQSGKPVLRVTVDGPATCRNFSISARVVNLKFGSPSNGWAIVDKSAVLNEAL